ncbi:MAG: hypothetical protein EOP93_12190 [Lysobacteraceae bacterium]|nr:MAG: hypothetical protein EOP93_12190 [Xanthomonadaceae bacterium]
MRKLACLAASLLIAFAANAQDRDLSSGRDYSDPVQRDRPIACKAGDSERFPGKSLGDVFGADWPTQPMPSSPGTSAAAQLLERGPIRWPRGLDAQDSFTVVAILVDAAGKPLRAEILCSTRVGFDKSVRNHAMASSYAPAQVDGVPVTSALVRVVSVRALERGPSAKPRRTR